MKRFVFRLQTALDLRRRKEEALRAELAKAQARAREEDARLQALLAALARAVQSAAAGRVGRTTAEDLRDRSRHLADLEDGIETQRRLLDLARADAERCMAAVVAATQETKSLENLRERHLQEHRRQEMAEEQTFLDELASIRAARRSHRRPETGERGRAHAAE